MQNNTALGALLLRVSLGTIFIAHGLLKILVFTLPGTAAFFESVGFPGWTAYPVTGLEILGGLLLIAGIATRATSIALIPLMLGATSVHAGAGWVFSNADGGWEYPVFLTVALAVQALIGPGTLTLRSALSRHPANA